MMQGQTEEQRMKLIRSIAAGVMYRVQQYLNDIGQQELFCAAPELSDAIEEMDVEALDLLEQEEKRADGSYYRLITLLGGTPAGQTLLDLTCAVMLHPKFGTLLKTWRGHLVTPEFAYFMENEDTPTYDMLYALHRAASRILISEEEAEPFFYQEFFADNRLFGYLNGSTEIDRRLEHAAEMFRPDADGRELPPLTIRVEQCFELQKIYETRTEDVWIRGNRGCGKKHLLKHALCKSNKQLVFADAAYILNNSTEKSRLIWLIRREALLNACDVCIYGISKEVLEKAKLTTEQFLYQVADPFRKEGIRLIFCTDTDVELIPYMDRAVHMLEIEKPTREERIQLWKQYLNDYGLELDPVLLGTKYKFSPEEIHRAVRQLRAESGDGNVLPRQTVIRTLAGVMPPLTTKGRIEPPHENCTMDSLVLPPQTIQTLKQICDHVRFGHQVFDEWNMESRFAYGKAVSVLLCGPPGTGKTMTARVLSDELGLPLYHVNLSQIVDKYIGETEKHLEEIFSNAEKSNIILFFDEADSVFSKRSTVTDAKDKYANTEVSYILQRLEAYDGIVILSTNFLNNIDAAFIRRIQYVITFYMPGAEERKKMWQSAIPEECPTGQIDFDYLAEQFEFSGSNIKSAVLTSVFYAAGQGESLGMRHLIYGIRNEFVKKGKPVFAADFGEYGYLCQ